MRIMGLFYWHKHAFYIFPSGGFVVGGLEDFTVFCWIRKAEISEVEHKMMDVFRKVFT